VRQTQGGEREPKDLREFVNGLITRDGLGSSDRVAPQSDRVCRVSCEVERVEWPWGENAWTVPSPSPFGSISILDDIGIATGAHLDLRPMISAKAKRECESHRASAVVARRTRIYSVDLNWKRVAAWHGCRTPEDYGVCQDPRPADPGTDVLMCGALRSGVFALAKNTYWVRRPSKASLGISGPRRFGSASAAGFSLPRSARGGRGLPDGWKATNGVV